MPLKEKINEFAIAQSDRQEQKEEDYHDGTICIDVVNQDPKLPYWFRQKHPFVWNNYYHLVGWNNGGDRIFFDMSISGSAYRFDQHQHVTVEMKIKDAIHLMQQLKEAIDHVERIVKPSIAVKRKEE